MQTALRINNSRVTLSYRTSQSCEIYLQEHNQILTVSIREKSPPASGRGSGKVNILEYTQSSLPNKACPQGKLFYRSLMDWGFTKA